MSLQCLVLCYDANYLDDQGVLRYDPRKDKRYSHYLANRNLYKIDGVYTFSATDSLYTKQRSLYLAVLDEFNAERMKVGEELLTEEKMLPSAYTSKERESIKTFSDTAYGHYDHATSPLILNKVAGILFGQFLRFYPDKVKFYLGTENEASNRGYMGQKYELKKNGSKALLWRQDTILENGDHQIEEVEEKDLRPGEIKRPAMGWVGEPTEGILYSLAHTTHDLLNGELDTTDPQRVKRAKLALNDLLASLIFLWLGSLMLGDKKSWAEKNEGEKLLTKLGLKSMNELNVVASLFGSVKATPAFIEILGNTGADLKKFMNGDMAAAKLLKENVRMLELLPIGGKVVA